MNTVREYFRLYETNRDFKEYVDKYCSNAMKSVEEVLQYQVVREYAEYLLKSN